MPPRRRGPLTMSNITLFDNAKLVLIRPMPTANTISNRKNLNLRVVDKS